ncbi:hypothetical protein EWM64_g443 [Hericium alpestre]|uniref:Xylanolytic transcriptional activator regulatory domain-containing protein n=1 Tax=Hericium alpestre TaxID=135208 RepID=A0A4Z0AA36_9AGAM|nr:hypothetical protein EWM64_g443 [Hericium alpestre]
MFRLLHRPTFERQFADGLYTRDVWFACVCMCVFAQASRYTDDERVLLPEPPDKPPDEEMARLRWQKAGFGYYFAAIDVILHKQSLMVPAGLFEMQATCLTSAFARDTHWHPNAWIVIGIGARKIQDVGAHRKQVYGATPSVEDELWRRAFWHLVAWDRIGSVMLGRPCIMRDEDFDTPHPLEIDDEYWESDDPALAFKQPPENPSALTAYVLWLKITDIIAFNMRTLYAVDKWKSRMGLKDPQKPEEILKQLNAALTQWATAVPEYHLVQVRWTPNIADPSVANQSATMYIAFNLLQISIHRSFLPQSASRLRALGAPTQQFSVDREALTHLAIAVNAARSITRIGEEIRRRSLANVTILMAASEISSAVLCLNVWIIKAREKARRAKGFERDLAAANTIDALMEDINSLVAEFGFTDRFTAAARSYLKSALPGATNEPTDLDGMQLEIMTSVEFDYHSDMPVTASPNPWVNVRHYGRTEDQFSMPSSSTAQASPPDDSIMLQDNLETLPLDKLMRFLRPNNACNQKDHKLPNFAPPAGSHRAMPPPPLPTRAPAAQWYNVVAPTPQPYPSPSFSPPFTTNRIAPPESSSRLSNSVSAEHLPPFHPSSSRGPYGLDDIPSRA